MSSRATRLVLGLLPVALVLAGCAADGPRPAALPEAAARPQAAAPPEAVAVLRGWDARRERAWAAGDVGALRGLYAPGSAAGRQDVALLRDWSARGLRVTAMRRQLLAVAEVQSDHDVLVLRVDDRLAGGTVESRTGAVHRLPAGAPATRVVRLARHEGAWVVSAVRAVRGRDAPGPRRPPR